MKFMYAISPSRRLSCFHCVVIPFAFIMALGGTPTALAGSGQALSAGAGSKACATLQPPDSALPDGSSIKFEVLPALSCDRESSLRSMEATTTTSIEFVNLSSQVVQIYWLDYNGTRRLYNTLKPAESYVQSTFLTHPWVVTDSRGSCLAIYLPLPQPSTAQITDSGRSPVTVNTRLMTKDPLKNSDCQTPVATGVFVSTDTAAYLWFSVSGAQKGDRARAEWFDPANALYTTLDWDPLTWEGNGCFWGWISIAGSRPSTQMGNWSVKVSYNGVSQFTETFRIVPPGTDFYVSLNNRMMTKDPLTNSGCSTPERTSNFLTTDQSAWVWFSFSSGQVGDRVTTEWMAPDNTLYRRFVSDAAGFGGDGCYHFFIAVAGWPPATMPGNWKVRVLYNATELFTEDFLILEPGPQIKFATPPPTNVDASATVILDASATTGKAPLQFIWTVTYDSVNVPFTAPAAGKISFVVPTAAAGKRIIVSLTVTDSGGARSSKTVEIVVTAPNTSNLPTITTVAGGYLGDNGPAVGSALAFPRYLAMDRAGNLFFSDSLHNRVRKIDPSGIITTIAGTAFSGYSGDGGPATAATLNLPAGVAFDPSGNLVIADWANDVIRKVVPSGIITTIAGNGRTGYSGDGSAALAASLSGPLGIAYDSAGNLYVADSGNQVVRRISTNGIITTVAGSGVPGFSGDGGPALAARLNSPRSVLLDARGTLYIVDSGNRRVRKVDTTGVISTVAGNGAEGFSGDNGPATQAAIGSPRALAFDLAGNLFISNAGGGRIRRVDSTGIITTVAGSSSGFNGDGKALATSFYLVTGMLFDSTGNVLVADSGNGRIRRIDPAGTVTTIAGGVAGDGNPATSSNLNSPDNISVDNSGNLFIVEGSSHRVRKVDTAGQISTIAGSGVSGHSGDGGPAISAKLYFPLGVAADASGNVFISDDVYIRKVDRFGIIATIAGNGSFGYSGDGGVATSAGLQTPASIAVDNSGNVYFADQDSCVIRKISSSGTISTVVGNGNCGFSGDGGLASAAMLNSPFGVAVDLAGNIYIADTDNHRIRKVSTSGTITTIAGTGAGGFSGDGSLAVSANLFFPTSVALDSAQNIYVADNGNLRIRKIDASGVVSTVAGSGQFGYSGDGGSPIAARLANPIAVAVDGSGNVYFSDDTAYVIRKITSGPTSPGSNLIGPAGGRVIGFGGDQLTIAPGTFTSGVKINLGSVPQADVQTILNFDLAANGFNFVRAVTIDSSGAQYLKPAVLSVDKPAGMDPGSQVAIFQLFPDVNGDGRPDLVLVDVGIVKGSKIESFASTPLPGIRGDGTFVLLNIQSPVAYITGVVRDSSGRPAVRATVTSIESPKLFALTDSTGNYALALSPQDSRTRRRPKMAEQEARAAIAGPTRVTILSSDAARTQFGIRNQIINPQTVGGPIILTPAEPILIGAKNEYILRYNQLRCFYPDEDEVRKKVQELLEKYKENLSRVLEGREIAYQPKTSLLSCDQPRAVLRAYLIPEPEVIRPVLQQLDNVKTETTVKDPLQVEHKRTIKIIGFQLGTLVVGSPVIDISPPIAKVVSNEISGGALVTTIQASAEGPQAEVSGQIKTVDVGFSFEYSVTLDPNADECQRLLTVTPKDELALKLNFAEKPLRLGGAFVTVRDYTNCKLRVTKFGAGSGAVSSSPPGIDCGPDCLGMDHFFPRDSEVTLAALARAGSKFDGWEGPCLGTGNCVVKMDGSKAVIARFLPTSAEATLVLTKIGNGSGAVSSAPPGINCPPGCSTAKQSFVKGTEVTLSALAASGSLFDGWGGACSGKDPCVVKLDTDKEITARFSLVTRRLSVTKSGTGSGSVVSVPAGINCPENCLGADQFFADGAEVTLTAAAQTGSQFDGWSGACTAASGPCVVKMDADKGVIAKFSAVFTSVAGTYKVQDLFIGSASDTGRSASACTFQHSISATITTVVLGGNGTASDPYRGSLSASAKDVVTVLKDNSSNSCLRLYYPGGLVTINISSTPITGSSGTVEASGFDPNTQTTWSFSGGTFSGNTLTGTVKISNSVFDAPIIKSVSLPKVQ
ncbi:MAG TPA: hypothetical protein VGL91_05415 [Acidobacteriota bacterium]